MGVRIETTPKGRHPMPNLPSRTYDVSWHWRDDDPANLLKTDEIVAPHAEAAAAALRAWLRQEYTFDRAHLVVIEIRETRVRK